MYRKYENVRTKKLAPSANCEIPGLSEHPLGKEKLINEFSPLSIPVFKIAFPYIHGFMIELGAKPNVLSSFPSNKFCEL